MNNNNNLKREESFEEKSKLPQKANSEKYKEELKKKLTSIEKETKEMKLDPEQFKNNSLPLARIKKIMKSDDGVKMIAGEAPILFSKACELFIIDLAYLSWVHTVDSNRRTLQKSDIAEAISQTDYFDFLLDIVQESTKKKLQMYASGYDPSGVNALGPLENYGGFMPPNNPYMLMNNLNPSYPQNMMYQPNPSLNNSLTPGHVTYKKENDKQSDTPGNSLLNYNYNLGSNPKPSGHK